MILDQNYYHHCTTAHKDIKLHKTETGIGECAYTNWGEDGGQDADAEAEAERDEAKQHRFTGCFSLYLNVGHSAAQIEHTKINDTLQNEGEDRNIRIVKKADAHR